MVKHKQKEQKKEHKTEHEAPHKKEQMSSVSWILIGVVAIAAIALMIFIPKLLDGNEPSQIDDEVLIATVNGEKIFSGQVEKKLQYMQAQFGPAVTEDIVINQTINEVLILQEAKKLGIKADNAEIDAAVNEWLTSLRNSVSEEQLDAILQEDNMTLEDYVEDIRQIYTDNYIIYAVINKTVLSALEIPQPGAAVTDEDVRKEYDENQDMYNQISASHILICFKDAPGCESNNTKEEAKELIDGIYAELLEGGDFAELANKHSSDSTGADGGRLGWFGKGRMVPEFEEAAFALRNVNQFTQPVETQFGFHIIKLDGRKSGFDEVKDQIKTDLQAKMDMEAQQDAFIAQQEAVKAYIDQLREDAEIVMNRQNLTEGITPDPKIRTFSTSTGEICTEDGKPVVHLFSTTWCPHCNWITETYEKVVKEYVARGEIVAYHWQLDTNDDAMTEAIETIVPQAHMDMYKRFNPSGSIPTFVFGCRYYRVGNGYEAEQNLMLEEVEFRAVLDKLLNK